MHLPIAALSGKCHEGFVDRCAARAIHQAVVRPGKAHRDEFLACCLLLGMNPSMSIQRRDAKEIDLTNPHVAVIDQGGLLDSELTCFDDHVPNPRELCSLSLILDALGSLEHARHTWPWLAATEIMDLRGLGAVNRAFSIPRGQLDSGGTWLAVASPLDKYLINVFGRRTVIRAGQDVHSLMRDMGAEMVSELVNSAQHFALLDHHSETWAAGESDPLCILWIGLPADRRPDKWLSGYCQRQPIYPDVVVVPARFGKGVFVQFRTHTKITPWRLAERLGSGCEANSSGVRVDDLCPERLQFHLSAVLGMDDSASV